MQIMTKRFYLTVKIYIWKWKKRKKMMREKLSKVSQVVSKSRVKGQQWKTVHLALANEYTFLWTHCCSWCFLGAQTRGTQNECCVSMLRKLGNIFCVPDRKFLSATNVARAGKGETFVSATMCPQQSALVCQGLLVHVAVVICIHITWFERMMDDFNV